MAKRTTLRAALPDDDDYRKHLRLALDIIREVQRDIAPFITFRSLYEGDDLVEAVIDRLGKGHILDNLRACIEELEATTGNERRVAVPIPLDKQNTERLADAVLSLVSAYGEAGYLLGLGIGSQLGPQAFGGGK